MKTNMLKRRSRLAVAGPHPEAADAIGDHCYVPEDTPKKTNFARDFWPVRERPESARTIAEFALTLAGLFLLTLILQYMSGTFARELAGYPDEPTHYVTGLMIRDYIAAGAPAPPLQYATDYYQHYPKVGLGHWPPVFYVVQAAWTLIFTTSRTSILILMGLITALLAAAVGWKVRAVFGRAAGVLTACAFVALPGVQGQTAMVMPDVLLALFGFQAAIHFGNYLDTEDWREAAWFGAFASLCILTKGNGWALALLPLLAILFARKPRLLLRSSLWASATLVGVLCASWYLPTAPFVRHVWISGPFNLAHAGTNAAEIMKNFTQVAGLTLLGVAILGMVATTTLPARKREGIGMWASMVALFWSVFIFNSVVPLGVEARKLTMAVPAMLMLIAGGLVFLSKSLRGIGQWARALPALLAAVSFAQTFSIPQKPELGFIEAAEIALSEDSAASSTYFVSGTSSGEGAFIAEIAMRDERPSRSVIRASKTLATSNWNGGNYKLLVGTTEEVRRKLKNQSVSVIVMEDTPALDEMKHHVLLTRMLKEHPDEWIPVATRSTNRVRVFRRAGL